MTFPLGVPFLARGDAGSPVAVQERQAPAAWSLRHCGGRYGWRDNVEGECRGVGHGDEGVKSRVDRNGLGR